MGYIIARIIAIILLIWALDDHPYSYYTLLRFAVSGFRHMVQFSP